jgi:hypothetical protein
MHDEKPGHHHHLLGSLQVGLWVGLPLGLQVVFQVGL